MEAGDARENRPQGSNGGERLPGVEPGGPLRAARAIDPLAPDATKADPAATLSYHPSASGIALALGTGGAVAIHDPGEFARELTENGLVESADIESLRQQVLARGGPSDAAALARALVRYGRLTPYQAAAVLQGKTRGLMIGNYVVLDKLGAGSMGMVFKARHRLLKRIVALKLLPPSLARDPGAVQRFEREAKAAATLAHPNVVSVLDADEFRGLHFLVMEYVEGRDLARVVRERGPLPVSQAIDCIVQAARGLKAAFEGSVVHRDVKPSNLLLQSGGTVKILDMGLARLDAVGGEFGANQPDASLTQSNVILGTIDYMSPEQASNPRNADHRSDIYSLGCTLHYLLTGWPPFSGETLVERLIAHREQPIPSLSSRRPEVSAKLDDLLLRVLAKAPDDRFSSFDELIAGLEACRPAIMADVDVPASSQPVDVPPNSSRRRRATVAALVVGFAVTLGLLLTIINLRRHSPSQTSQERPQVAAEPVVATQDIAQAPQFATRPPEAFSPVPVQRPPQPERRSVTLPTLDSALKTALPNEPVGLVRELRGHEGRVNGIAVSANGSLALSGGQDRTVRLWNVATGNEVRRVDHDGPVYAVALSADGRQGLSCSADKTVRLWEFRARSDVGMRRLDGHTAAVFAVVFAPGDQFALSAGADRTVRVWDLATGQLSGAPLVHDSAVVALAATGGDGFLAGCDDGTIWLWDLQSRQRVRRLKAPGPILSIAGSPMGRRALSGHADGVLVLWDIDLGTEIGPLVGHGDLVRSAALLRDGRRALAGSQFGHLILWDIDSQRELRRFPPAALNSRLAGELGLVVCADDVHALSADTDGAVRFWRLPGADGLAAPIKPAGP
jgi:eukaryotic-like serine/threonine-protein kinase